MKTTMMRALIAAGAFGLIGASITEQMGCDQPPSAASGIMQEPDRICAPGTKLDAASRTCVCG